MSSPGGDGVLGKAGMERAEHEVEDADDIAIDDARKAATLGLGYWFFAAPALRFGYGFLLAQPLLILCLVIPVPRDRPSPRIIRHVAPGFAVVALFLALDVIVNLPAETLLSSDRPEIPIVEVVEQQTIGGERYFSPKIGDSCWASPRFCTPVPGPGLAFEQFGPWRMSVATPR
jgi:hypothetical protein